MKTNFNLFSSILLAITSEAQVALFSYDKT